ncbi:MAG: hypothetical protein M3R29_02895 [Verrucomicrobiota bacterium]|nr:hypothetical protein [Verrucomicrobiota bacterium]
MKLCPQIRAFKLIEMMFTTVLIGVLGLLIYSLLNINTVLGAKNTAVNTAHQQARVAMLQMVQDLRSAVSLPALANASGTPYPSPAPTAAAGIAFQQWASGPHKIRNDVKIDENVVKIKRTGGQPVPQVGQRLIVPTHQIEDDITAVANKGGNDYDITLAYDIGDTNKDGVVDNKDTRQVEIEGTGSSVGDVVCFITDRCSYTIASNSLTWTRQGSRVMVNDITSSAPFSTPTTPAGALYYRFVAAIDLSTADLMYSNRGYKSANVLLNGQVPMRTRLTTYQ